MDITELSEYEIDGYGMRCMLLLDKGIQRIKSVATWPDDKLPDKIQSVFPKFCEYIAFNMGTLYPFFEVIYSFVSADRLFASLCKTDFQREKLSYDEAFEFLLSFSDDCHSFLDSYGKMSSYSQNMILCSLEEKDFSKFSIALDNGDYSDFLCKLSILRYILSGKNQSPDFYGKDSHSIKNEWLSICNWVVYFLDYEDEADFVYKMRDQIIRRIIGIEKIETYLDEITPGEIDSCEKESDFSDILEFIDNPQLIQKNQLYYEGWFNDWTQLVLNRNACRNKIVELTDDSDNIIRNCQSMSCGIMEMPILSHPKESEQYIRNHYIKYRTLDKLLWGHFDPDEIDLDSIEEVDEYTYSFKIPRLKNHKGFAHSPVSHNYVSIVEKYLADNRIDRWKYTYENVRYRGDSYGDYVLLMIYRIAEVYNYMTDYLNDNPVVSKLLNYIIFRSPYKDIILNIVCNSSYEELQSANTTDRLLNNETSTNTPCPLEISNRKRLRNHTLINKVCVYLDSFFTNADTGDLLFVFFGMGKRPSKSLILKTTKKDLCLFITFLLGKKKGKKNIQKETWIYFANYITYGGTSVFPLDPRHKDWQSNPPSGYATSDEKLKYKSTLRNVLKDLLKRELTKEELEDFDGTE